MTGRRLHSLPPWLSHALRAQRAPVPWAAVVRGALAGGPLLLAAVFAGRPSNGVLLALGAMLAGVNDRPGTRRAAVWRIGAPALAGALGLIIGTALTGSAVPLVVACGVLGLVAGASSAVGAVASAAGSQLLVAVAVAAGMPLPEAGWLRALLYVGGAGWLILLRLVLPSPTGVNRGRSRNSRGTPLSYLYDGERTAVAAVYDAIADLLDAVGGPDARARRAALTAALDQAQDALHGPRLRWYAGSAAERRLRAQY
ncbi:FUSC family protein, partial [Streptomyces sp. GXMU-J5]|nr:FUSC family protein [Streptomyces beihaiensis]